MKKFLPIILILFVGFFFFINIKSPSQVAEVTTIEEIMDADGTRVKNDFREALLEFGDEDDTLDSLDYVPDWLR